MVQPDMTTDDKKYESRVGEEVKRSDNVRPKVRARRKNEHYAYTYIN